MMLFWGQLVLFAAHFILFVKAEDYLERLLYCPLNDKNQYLHLLNLINNGLQVDIFEEKVNLSSPNFLHVLSDNHAAGILTSEFGCFEEKSSRSIGSIKGFSKGDYKIGARFHDDYRSYQNIKDRLYEYKKDHPEKIKLIGSIGKSHENRDLTVIHITSPRNTLGTKPLVWIMSGQHAREWIGPAATMYFIDQLLNNQLSEKLLNDFEFAVMPLVNPDGYEFSRTVNRMWRKNRRPNGSVDLNRNWDILWGELDASKFPQAISYAGPFSASEPEVSSTQNYILSLQNRKIGFDIHSYGQLILRNNGFTINPSPLEHLNRPLSERMAIKMSEAFGMHYKALTSAELYICSGGADDWMYMKAGIPGFTIELRDTGRYGFNLPKEQIRPTGEELFVGIIAALEQFRY